MRKSKLAAILFVATVTSLASCSSEKVTVGPCVGDLCLGEKNRDLFEECTGNISQISNLTYEECRLKGPLSISGIHSTSGVVKLLDGVSGFAMVYFNPQDCQKIKALLEGKFGRVEKKYAPSAAVDPSKISFGDLRPVYQWDTENGFFSLGGMGDFKGDHKCRLQIESKAVQEMYNRRMKEGGSIRG